MTLDIYLTILRERKLSFEEGVNQAKVYISELGGECTHIGDEDTEAYHVVMPCGDEATLFKLYNDIDMFYFET